MAAFVSDRPLLSYQANLRPCDLAVVGDDFGPGAWFNEVRCGVAPHLVCWQVQVGSVGSKGVGRIEHGCLARRQERVMHGLQQCTSERSAFLNATLPMLPTYLAACTLQATWSSGSGRAHRCWLPSTQPYR